MSRKLFTDVFLVFAKSSNAVLHSAFEEDKNLLLCLIDAGGVQVLEATYVHEDLSLNIFHNQVC